MIILEFKQVHTDSKISVALIFKGKLIIRATCMNQERAISKSRPKDTLMEKTP